MEWEIPDKEFLDLKDVLLYSKTRVEASILIKVPYSRYKVIMFNYLTMNGIFGFEDKADTTDYFILSKLDDSGNVFKVLKTCTEREENIKGDKCECGRNKPPTRAKCYYCSRIETDYTTEIWPRLEI